MKDRIKDILASKGIEPVSERLRHFEEWAVTRLWEQYDEEIMNQRLITENSMRQLGLRLPNGTVGKPYTAVLSIPDGLVSLTGAAISPDTGLAAEIRGNDILVSGTPLSPGDTELTIAYNPPGTFDGEPASSLRIPVAFNPDPRSLWRDIPTPREIPFYKPDSDMEYLKVEAAPDGTPRKDVVAASRRGRSHAQEGNARDDDFRLFHCPDSDWYIIAVADGAGSARFSRRGSEIACDTVVEYCKGKLLDNRGFEEAVRAYHEAPESADTRKRLFAFVYDIVGNGAFLAHKAINAASDALDGTKPKDFATTLMFAVCKRFDFGWFVANYWVGDGAACIYDRKKGMAKLLGVPDEGEFSGQTRFLTMPEIFRDPQKVADRLRFGIYEDFTALLLMTDGVSDPMFETDVNLNAPARWDALWDTLRQGFPADGIPGVDLTDDNEGAKEQLLRWLDFWSPGNHDDRTIAILY